jgi:hypothetical protein
MRMSGRNAHRTATIVLSALAMAVGVALVAVSLASGVSALAARLVIGVLIVAAGAGRMYIELQRGRGA